MYHQFDRTLHPRQSVLNIIMNMNEQNKQFEEDIKDLESVSILKCLMQYIWILN
jgi:myotubularin-related protein 6/7/8